MSYFLPQLPRVSVHIPVDRRVEKFGMLFDLF